MKKTSILFLIEKFNQGGAERQLYELIKGLNKNQYNITILTWVPSSFFDDLKSMNGVNWIEMIRKSKFDFGLLSKAFLLIRTGNVDILHAYLDSAGFYGAICKFFFKRIIFIATERSSFKKLTFLQRIHKPISHRLADVTVTNSFAGYRYLETLGVIGKTIKIISNGIDSGKFRDRSDIPIQAFYEKFPQFSNARIILYPGRVIPIKNQLSVLKAYFQSTIINNFVLIFIGLTDKTYLQLLEKFIDENKLQSRVFILKETEDMSIYYLTSDFVILFSDLEGTPNVILEAMASEKAVVSSDVGDVNRYVDKSFGWIIPPNDTKQLMQVFDTIDKLPREQLVLRGKLAREKFNNMECDTSDMVRKHEKLYEELMTTKKVWP